MSPIEQLREALSDRKALSEELYGRVQRALSAADFPAWHEDWQKRSDASDARVNLHARIVLSHFDGGSLVWRYPDVVKDMTW